MGEYAHPTLHHKCEHAYGRFLSGAVRWMAWPKSQQFFHTNRQRIACGKQQKLRSAISSWNWSDRHGSSSRPSGDLLPNGLGGGKSRRSPCIARPQIFGELTIDFLPAQGDDTGTIERAHQNDNRPSVRSGPFCLMVLRQRRASFLPVRTESARPRSPGHTRFSDNCFRDSSRRGGRIPRLSARRPGVSQ
ncbi:MAG: hypothetical protein JWN24_3025 [Phycisphaerales bacterium]|nr:hypothetical protein [Phycisphaerales bacterium]